MTTVPTDQKTRLEPIAIRPEQRIRTFSDDDLDRLHAATLTVLSDAGVHMPGPLALDTFEAAGAAVDRHREIVRIPPDLLMTALARAPRHFTMGARGGPDLDVRLDGSRIHLGTNGTGTTTVDLITRLPRPSTKADVAMMATIVDHLPGVSFYWPMVSARDVPDAVIPLHEIEASFTGTGKHVHIVNCTTPAQAAYAVEMARVVAGDAQQMRRRPPLSLVACPISPLSHDGEALAAALEFARHGLPVGFATMPMLGATAPASLAGLLVTGNAELLSAICLLQLVCPGAPVYYAFFATVLNPYTGTCTSSTEHQPLLNAAVIDIGHYYDLPVMSGFGAGDSRVLNTWRTGKELCLDTMYVYLHQPDLVPAMGLLDNDTLLYPEQLLLDDDVHRTLRRMGQAIDLSPAALALDEILAVGPAGHFLDRAYTSTHIRRLWTPGVTRRWSPERGEMLDPVDAATETIHRILDTHRPEPLEDRQTAALRHIVATAEKEMLT